MSGLNNIFTGSTKFYSGYHGANTSLSVPSDTGCFIIFILGSGSGDYYFGYTRSGIYTHIAESYRTNWTGQITVSNFTLTLPTSGYWRYFIIAINN